MKGRGEERRRGPRGFAPFPSRVIFGCSIETLDDDFESLTVDQRHGQKTVSDAIHPIRTVELSGKEWTIKNYRVHRIKTNSVFQCRKKAGYYQSHVENTFYQHETISSQKTQRKHKTKPPVLLRKYNLAMCNIYSHTTSIFQSNKL